MKTLMTLLLITVTSIIVRQLRKGQLDLIAHDAGHLSVEGLVVLLLSAGDIAVQDIRLIGLLGLISTGLAAAGGQRKQHRKGKQ